MNDDDIAFLTELETIIRERLEQPADDSYTCALAAGGIRRVAQKLGEEAVELALAAVDGERQELLDESADLVYHLLLLLHLRGVRLTDVAATLASRH